MKFNQRRRAECCGKKSFVLEWRLLTGSIKITDVLNKMVGLDGGSMKKIEAHDETFDKSVAVEITLTGGMSGFILL